MWDTAKNEKNTLPAFCSLSRDASSSETLCFNLSRSSLCCLAVFSAASLARRASNASFREALNETSKVEQRLLISSRLPSLPPAPSLPSPPLPLSVLLPAPPSSPALLLRAPRPSMFFQATSPRLAPWSKPALAALSSSASPAVNVDPAERPVSSKAALGACDSDSPLAPAGVEAPPVPSRRSGWGTGDLGGGADGGERGTTSRSPSS